MCTVTYIPDKNKGNFVLTSNRDEVAYRPTISPQLYKHNNKELYFPKDTLAGGSWISMTNNGRVVCLLNGAFVAHIKKPNYEQSRGNILLELASSDKNPEQYFDEKNLREVEPFTIVTVENKEGEINHLSEFIWDGSNKHFRKLDQERPHIWSSVTLYNSRHRKLRQRWFGNFLQKTNGSIAPENIFEFHSGTHINDNSVNLVMERKGGLKTVSITQIVARNNSLKMKYFDLQCKTETEVEL